MNQHHGGRLYLSISHEHDHAVVTAIGTIGKHTVVQLRSILLPVLHRNGPFAVLDLFHIDDIDDIGLDALRRTADRARALGGYLHLAAARPAVAERLHDSGLDRLIPTYPTVAAATGASRGADTDMGSHIDQSMQHSSAESRDTAVAWYAAASTKNRTNTATSADPEPRLPAKIAPTHR